MYLSELRLWNFRKYTNEDGVIDETKPHLTVPFTKGLNVLIGENDSGKTAILDAIKLVTKTHSMEWIHLVETDFSVGCDNLRIDKISVSVAPFTVVLVELAVGLAAYDGVIVQRHTTALAYELTRRAEQRIYRNIKQRG